MALCYRHILHRRFYASIADGPVAKAQSIWAIIGIWIFTFVFTLDRPLWFKARIRYLNALSQGCTDLFSQNKTQSAPAIPDTGGSPVPRSHRGIGSLPGGGTKWVVGLSLVFAVLSIIAVACAGIPGDRHQNDRLGSSSWQLTGAILPSPGPSLTISALLVAARFSDLVTCCRTGASAG